MKNLIIILQEYVSVLESSIPKDIQVNTFQNTFLDFIFRNRENVKAIIKLLDSFDNEDFIFLPIASILRTLSTDTLTFYYLLTYLSNDLSRKQITFENELDALRIESIMSMDKIIEYEKELGLEGIIDIEHAEKFYKSNVEKILKNRNDIHKDSDPKVLKGYKNSRKFLSEEAKVNRIKLFTHSEEIKKRIYSLFVNYKYLSFYYHYSPIGGKLSRTFELSNFGRMQSIIKVSILSIIHITDILDFIDEDVTKRLEDCFDKLNKKTP